MPLTKYLPTIKILSHEDLRQLSLDGNFNLEIYLDQAEILQIEIVGYLKIFSMGCNFPNLKIVHKKIIVNGKFNNFPKLERIGGKLTVKDYGTWLPNLKVIGKNFNNYCTSFHLPNVRSKEEKSGFMNSKNIKTDFPEFRYKWKVIRNQNQLDNALKEGHCNLYFQNTDVILPNKLLVGHMVLDEANVNAPNLIQLKGDLIFSKNKNLFDAPKFEKIEGNCKFYNCKLPIKSILGNISVYGDCDLPHLTCLDYLKVKSYKKYRSKRIFDPYGILYIAEHSILRINNLEKTSHTISLSGNLEAKKLNTINLSRLNYTTSAYYPFDNFIFVKSKFEYSWTSSNCLNYLNTPNLTFLYGKVLIDEEIKNEFPKLRFLEAVTYNNPKFVKDFVNNNARSLIKIDEIKYLELPKHLEANFAYKINDNEKISKKWYYIGEKLKFPLEEYISIIKMNFSSFENFHARIIHNKWIDENREGLDEVLSYIKDLWESTSVFNFDKAFNFRYQEIRAFIFRFVNLSEMMTRLSAKKIASQTIAVNHIVYTEKEDKLVKRENHYEVYEADFGNFKNISFRGNSKVFALKCWCPSTDNEHWLWIEEQYSENPLEAVASTFRIHENVIPYIKYLKRQGDLLFCEMEKEIIPSGEIRPLTAKEYFDLLIAES